ncbi:MAG: hypothetical protein U0W40_00890 [Acidimicrobiia bacterium]
MGTGRKVDLHVLEVPAEYAAPPATPPMCPVKAIQVIAAVTSAEGA